MKPSILSEIKPGDKFIYENDRITPNIDKKRLKVNYVNKSDNMKKIEKQSIPNMMNLLWRLSQHWNVLFFIKPSSELYDGKKLLLEQWWMFLSK